MEEIITPDEHDAEIAALQHEIYRLNRIIQDKDKEALSGNMSDPDDPFDNPTEYKHYNESYRKIQPQLGEPGYRIPLDPDYPERRRLRKYYSKGSLCILFQFGLSMLLPTLLIKGIMVLLAMKNPEMNAGMLYDHMYGSSILTSINMIVYLLCNVLCGLLGLKWTKTKGSQLIQTTGYGFGRALQYCFIGIFIWLISIRLGTVAEVVLDKFGLKVTSDTSGLGVSPLGVAITTLYSCIIAPVTEEFLFRGMVLKVFSKADQRFAIYISAFFFAIAHGNVPQFILAFLMGIFLAHITLRHNSIIPAVAVHIFINTFSTLFGMLSGKSSTVQGIGSMVLFGSAFIGLILLAIFRGENGGLPDETPHQKRRGFYVAVSSLPFLAACSLQTMHMIYMLLNRH